VEPGHHQNCNDQHSKLYLWCQTPSIETFVLAFSILHTGTEQYNKRLESTRHVKFMLPVSMYQQMLSMRNVTLIKGNKLAAVLGTADICQLFLFCSKKMSQKVVFNLLLLVRIPKWGLPFLYHLYPKIIVKK
jgi:hypothetical protein